MWAPETRDGTCRELLLLKLFHRGSSDSPASSVENPCTRLTSVIPSTRVNFIASRGMSGNGPTTVMLKGILEQLAEGHQLPKKLCQRRSKTLPGWRSNIRPRHCLMDIARAPIGALAMSSRWV